MNYGLLQGLVYGIVAHCFGLLGFPRTCVWSLEPRYLYNPKDLVFYRLMPETWRADNFRFALGCSLEERRQREKAELSRPFLTGPKDQVNLILGSGALYAKYGIPMFTWSFGAKVSEAGQRSLMLAKANVLWTVLENYHPASAQRRDTKPDVGVGLPLQPDLSNCQSSV